MKAKGLVSMVLVVVMAVGSFGCATQAGTGAGIGAALGGIAGAIICKGRTDCIIAGAAIGGVTGLAVGAYLDKQVADRKTAMAQYEGKQASDGKVYIDNGNIRKDLLELEKNEVNPLPVKVGGEITTAVQYTVISQYADSKVDITEKRFLVVDDDRLPVSSRNLKVEQGTKISAYKVKLPDGIDPGEYQLITEVIGLNQTKKITTIVKIQG